MDSRYGPTPRLSPVTLAIYEIKQEYVVRAQIAAFYAYVNELLVAAQDRQEETAMKQLLEIPGTYAHVTYGVAKHAESEGALYEQITGRRSEVLDGNA